MLFRARWILPRCSPTFFDRLKVTLANPWTFYAAALALIGRKGSTSPFRLRLHDNSVALIPSFMSLYVFEEIFLDGIYDLDVSPVETIIDIGANTGMFVLRAKQRWPNAKIVAFEPEPGNFAMLQKTIKENDLTDVMPYQAAVSGDHDEVTLYLSPSNVGGHSTIYETNHKIVVQAKTVRDALDHLGGKCDLMKVDCEGAELQIFNSLDRETADRIKAIVYEPEWKLYSVDDLNGRLGMLGFSTKILGASVMATKEQQ